MAYCRECGFHIPDDSIFCPQCGVRIETNIVNEAQENRNLANKNHDLNIEMVFVEGGSFLMGKDSNVHDIGPEVNPLHEVTVNDFLIGKFQITQKQWKEIMGENPSKFADCDNCPVEQVSWNDVQIFLGKLNEKSGKKYRLPTEAEWEYAARGGGKSKGVLFCESDNCDDVGWFDSINTHPVGLKQPNELGVYDMLGNVEEWCYDKYSDNYYKYSTPNNPWGPIVGNMRVFRGGSFGNSWYEYFRRNQRNPEEISKYIGFRVVISDTEGSPKEEIVISDKIIKEISSNMIFIEGGSIQMYDLDGLASREIVLLNNFEISKYPVTQKQWKEIMGYNYSSFQGDNLPVESLDLDEILEFIRRLNKVAGSNYRLPTNAEWEYAAKGGKQSKGYTYSGSNNFDEVAWCNENSGGILHPVGLKKPNELGIYDMSGNVNECCDENDDVARGSRWEEGAWWCTIARGGDAPESVGFRLAR